MDEWMKQYPNTVVTRLVKGDPNYASRFRGEADKLLYQLKNDMQFNKLGRLDMKRFFTDGTIIRAKSIFGHDIVEIDVTGVIAVEAISARPIVGTYDFKENKIFFRGVTERFYIDLSEIVDNWNDGGGVGDRRYQWLVTGPDALLPSLAAFALLEEDGLCGAFIIATYPYSSETDFYLYKFKVLTPTGDKKEWIYKDDNCAGAGPLYPTTWTEFTIDEIYTKYSFIYTKEKISLPGSVFNPEIRQFIVYSGSGYPLGSLADLKWGLATTLKDSLDKNLYWYDSGRPDNGWNTLLTGILLSWGSHDIFNAVFELNLNERYISDCVVSWVEWVYSAPFTTMDFYVTDSHGVETWLWQYVKNGIPSYRYWPFIGYGSQGHHRQGGGISTSGERLTIMTGPVDWYEVGKAAYRIDGVWYTEDNVPSELRTKYPYGPIRGKELFAAAKYREMAYVPVLDEKEIAWSSDPYRGFHHIKVRYLYANDDPTSDFIVLGTNPINYGYGRIDPNHVGNDILVFSSPQRYLNSAVGKIYDSWGFMSDFAVY
jgi:hypothetical protein